VVGQGDSTPCRAGRPRSRSSGGMSDSLQALKLIIEAVLALDLGQVRDPLGGGLEQGREARGSDAGLAVGVAGAGLAGLQRLGEALIAPLLGPSALGELVSRYPGRRSTACRRSTPALAGSTGFAEVPVQQRLPTEGDVDPVGRPPPACRAPARSHTISGGGRRTSTGSGSTERLGQLLAAHPGEGSTCRTLHPPASVRATEPAFHGP